MNGRGRLRPIGVIRSVLKTRGKAPKQGSEGAPDAWLEVEPFAAEALDGLAAGDEIIVLTWLHLARRDVLKVHPRSDPRRPLTGVFATRSPDRPNPLGLHPVTVLAIGKKRLRIGPIEAVDGTPVVDIKPALGASRSTPPGGRLSGRSVRRGGRAANTPSSRSAGRKGRRPRTSAGRSR
jgi:tRNA-Thr(GGU) m(6)t(6)A37 methyltransferase TsaA